MGRKLLKVPFLKRTLSSPRADKLSDFNECSTSSVSEKGHFFVYTSEGKRFMVPLAYLNNNIFKELLKISEEEFGWPGDGPITLPCDAVSMEYVLSMLRRGITEEVERALLSSIFTSCQSTCSTLAVENTRQLAVCSCLLISS
ncbi:putative small auxin-up RNA [Dioscorea sansibarensis]